MDILYAYLITLGWALLGTIGMGIGLAIMLAIFTRLTPGIDEWKLIKENNIAMAIILASVIISCGLVVASAIRP
jgi:uncharacterized membrane protein YjfL (UPF0719 family)